MLFYCINVVVISRQRGLIDNIGNMHNVGWVEQSDTHHLHAPMMGIAKNCSTHPTAAQQISK
jgi:hypothetical protein